MSDHKTTDYSSETVGKIITVSRQIETQLHELTGSDAAGIHAQTEAAADILPEKVQQQLHYIGSVRNQAAHEDSFTISDEDLDHFLQTADSVSNAVKTAQENRSDAAVSSGKADGSSKEAAGKTTADKDSENAGEEPYAVEQEFYQKAFKNLMCMGYFPFVGIIQLLFLLLWSMKKHVWVLFMSIIYSCSIILLCKGFIASITTFIYLGAGCLLFAYIFVSGMAFKKPVIPKMPWYFWALPTMNIFYLPCRWLYDLCWSKFLMAMFGLCNFAGSIVLICYGFYGWSFVTLVVSWLCSIAGSLLWSKKK